METQIIATPRERAGRGASRRLRKAGRIPAVLYGPGRRPFSLSVDAKEFGRLFAQGKLSRLIWLKVADGARAESLKVLLKDVQKDPIKQQPLHLDFAAVALDQTVEVKVPVHLAGEARRIPDGAILELLLHEVEISCLPTEIPERVEADVSRLKIGESLLVKDLQVPPGVKIRSQLEEPVVLAAAPAKPSAAEATPPAAGEEQPSSDAAKKEKEE